MLTPLWLHSLEELEPLLVSQDSAVAVAFLVTEIIELAMNCAPTAQIRITVKADVEEGTSEPMRATLRISSAALIESTEFTRLNDTRYGRVIGGLVQQLRSRLHHDPLVGA